MLNSTEVRYFRTSNRNFQESLICRPLYAFRFLPIEPHVPCSVLGGFADRAYSEEQAPRYGTAKGYGLHSLPPCFSLCSNRNLRWQGSPSKTHLRRTSGRPDYCPTRVTNKSVQCEPETQRDKLGSYLFQFTVIQTN